jgi:exodeoxyribonuclease I
MSLVFYDTETTGTEPFFDQILQFAAIRTDAELNELDRFEVRCRLLPHVVPAPGAMRVTGVRASQLIDPSLPSHYEMIRAVRAKLLSWSPALFIGWNSISYDEDLLRQALYKTLHNPYLTNRDGNSRSDAMRIAQASSILSPGALRFPTDQDGQVVFKLDEIAPANGFAHKRAHDAMCDVEATLFLCRLLIDRAPEFWSSSMRFSTKAAVVDYITTEQLFCVSEFYFNRPYSCIVTAIGHNEQNTAEWYLYDLSVDPGPMRSLPDAQLIARLDRPPKPLRRLKSNAAPVLVAADDAPECCKGRQFGLEELERRAATLQADEAMRKRLVVAFESLKKQYPPSSHVEKQIYDGFFQQLDEQLMDAFHEAEWAARHAIVERFQDPRLRTIGTQLLHLERPDLLDAKIRCELDVATAKRILGQGQEVLWLTIPQAFDQLERMLTVASGVDVELLLEHREYLRDRREHALSHSK